jgi:DNA-binding LytR/AlgR family response regulator
MLHVIKAKRSAPKHSGKRYPMFANKLPFLEKCHRSYLVNLSTIKEIAGNSQGAKISFIVGEKEIPLSKTYYKHIKNIMF